MTSAATEPAIKITPLLPHQWPLLEPIFAAQGVALPPYSQLPAMIATDSDGHIVGVLLVHQWSVELEMFVEPQYREQGVGAMLAAAMEPEMDELKPFTAYARNESSAALCRRFGLTEQQGVLFGSSDSKEW